MKTSLIYFFLLLSSFLVFSTNEVLAQENDVKIKFEVEGKLQQVSRFAIIFHTKTGSFLAISKNKKFQIPKGILKKNEEFDVQVVWDKYSISFSSLAFQDFDAIWTVGVDTVPLEDETMASNQKTNKEIVGVFYLKIDRRKARATTQVITVYK